MFIIVFSILQICLLNLTTQWGKYFLSWFFFFMIVFFLRRKLKKALHGPCHSWQEPKHSCFLGSHVRLSPLTAPRTHRGSPKRMICFRTHSHAENTSIHECRFPFNDFFKFWNFVMYSKHFRLAYSESEYLIGDFQLYLFFSIKMESWYRFMV